MLGLAAGFRHWQASGASLVWGIELLDWLMGRGRSGPRFRPFRPGATELASEWL